MEKINIETILHEDNVKAAIKRVKKIKGGCGVDGVSTKEISDYWYRYGDGIKRLVREKRYIPAPMLRVYISKGQGKEKRMISIPAVVDRVLQHMLLMPMSELYEKKFSENSFGFRKGRGTMDALKKCMYYIEEGWLYVADIDISQFFDNVNHSILMNILKRDIEDEAVITLISRYINIDICGKNGLYKNSIGIPQGSPLSPLLANVFLNELDGFLTEKDYRFIRYADDIIILFRSFQDAANAMHIVSQYLENKLRLKINEKKSKIGYIDGTGYMGYVLKTEASKCIPEIADETIIKADKRLSLYIDNIKNLKAEEVWEKVGAFNRGWVNYFRYAESDEFEKILKALDEKEKELVRGSNNRDMLIRALIDAKGFVSCTDWYETIKDWR